MIRSLRNYVLLCLLVLSIWATISVERHLRNSFLERKRHFVAIRFAIEEFIGDFEVSPSTIEEVFPSGYEQLIGPFGGNLRYVKISRDTYLLEEPQKRMISIFKYYQLRASNNPLIDPHPGQWSAKP